MRYKDRKPYYTKTATGTMLALVTMNSMLKDLEKIKKAIDRLEASMDILELQVKEIGLES